MPISRSQIQEFDLSSVEDVLAIIRQETIDELIESLERVNRVSSGGLSQSINVDIVDDGGFHFILSMDEYWKFVDEGVDGTKKSQGSQFKYKKKNIKQQAVLEFIANRGIGLGNLATHYKNKDGVFKKRKKSLPKEKARKSQAWLIGRKIAERGLKPTNFYSDVINDDWKKDFTKRVSQALGRDILIQFKNINETINGK